MKICESGKGFNSKDYKNYKPYKEPERGYDWHDYVKLTSDSMSVVSCHMCDIRKTGCISQTTPRYYCHKDRRSIQTSLGGFGL